MSESPMMIHRALRVFEYWNGALVRRLLQPGMVAVDVGANKGDYSLMFARAVGRRGRVVAFEPDPENLLWLRKSLAANACQWVEVLDVALAEHAGRATFYPGAKSGWGSLRADHKRSDDRDPFEVAVRPLDDCLADLEIADIDLLKVDVEGGDLAVLEGARSLLSRSQRFTLLVDVDMKLSADDRASMLDLLRSCGLTAWKIGQQLQPVQILEAGQAICASRLALGPSQR
ncbi:MAG: FkbM family methyltransferase [Acidimicrobiales bacterium]